VIDFNEIDLVSDVVEFIRSNRVMVSRQDIIVELITVAAHSGGVWPRASSREWGDAIDLAVKRGLLQVSGERKELVGVAVVAGADKDSAQGEKLGKGRAKFAASQLSLFEMD
jgi:hypothetical protein